ncbi:unnamed protein product [Cylicocyclus nassatus]|uniref:Uncharacterized protein n=1 Tax=Cylicocyclus nassatus TaxID=53992 RepID=A0AA36MIM8_CYLNA|nr:unnamed protein product [Cylicocyclus nassatus]
MMIRALCLLAFVVGSLIEALPSRVRREDKIQRYCAKHLEHYRKFCENSADVDGSASSKLAKFCPAYEKHCSMSKRDTSSDSSDSEFDNLVVPPPLPKGSEFAALDLPIGSQSKSAPAASKTRLTAAIIASCTPECTAAHCTDECKCAHTHPKVHAMCNPPSNAQLADTCQKWYAKCPMFQPVQYY